MNKINLITGETYTLAELFSGQRKIIIPDLQRDYCWGKFKSENDGHTLVDGFISTVIRQFRDSEQRHRKLNIGLLYGYESPENFVQLCDGQQRITTLYLLLGMLNRWSGENRFISVLISTLNFIDEEKTPFLEYSVRDSSLYFLHDLVNRYFITGNDDSSAKSADGISSAGWFYGDYVTDPTVSSILEALRTIESYRQEILDCGIDHFFDFVTEKLTFIYYDMGNRANGEETFVIINTTGEPLTATENLKPLILNNTDGDTHGMAVKWEEIENWFWKKRDKNKYDTADPGFKEFIRWVSIIEKFDAAGVKNDDFEKILGDSSKSIYIPHKDSYKNILKVFETFRWIYENESSLLKGIWGESLWLGKTLEEKELFIVLPLIKYVMNFSVGSPCQLRRLYEFLNNLLRIDNVSKAIRQLIKPALIIGSECEDITDILAPDIMSKISETILTREELVKLRLLQRADAEPSERVRLERAIWHAQNLTVDTGNNLFEGEILTVLRWAGVAENLPRRDEPISPADIAGFSTEEFEKYIELLENRLKPVNENDSVRRALIAAGLTNYPVNGSYGWGYSNSTLEKWKWKTIINCNSEDFRKFLLHCDNEQTVRNYRILYRYDRPAGLNDKTGEVHTDFFSRHIVAFPELLEYADQKNIRHKNEWGLTLYKSQKANGVPASIAVIMVRLGLKDTLLTLSGNPVRCGRWMVRWSDWAQLTLTPAGEDSSVVSVTVSVANEGNALRFDVVKADTSYSITLGVVNAVNGLVKHILHPHTPPPRLRKTYRRRTRTVRRR